MVLFCFVFYLFIYLLFLLYPYIPSLISLCYSSSQADNPFFILFIYLFLKAYLPLPITLFLFLSSGLVGCYHMYICWSFLILLGSIWLGGRKKGVERKGERKEKWDDGIWFLIDWEKSWLIKKNLNFDRSRKILHWSKLENEA